MSKLGACMIIGGMFIIGNGLGQKDPEHKLPGQALQRIESFVRGLKLETYVVKAFKRETEAPAYIGHPLRMAIAGFIPPGLFSPWHAPKRFAPDKPITIGHNGDEYVGGYYRRRPYLHGYGNGYHNGYHNGYGNHNGYYYGNGYRDRFAPGYNPYEKYLYRNLRDRVIDVDDDDDDDGEFKMDLRIRAR